MPTDYSCFHSLNALGQVKSPVYRIQRKLLEKKRKVHVMNSNDVKDVVLFILVCEFLFVSLLTTFWLIVCCFALLCLIGFLT